MASTYQLHSSAKIELTDAVDWYEKERKGRGGKFFIAYLKMLDAILSRPLAFPLDFDQVRKAHIQKFPFTIYYEAFGSEVFVYSVFYNKRDPEAWKNRGN